jgi:hypothetical protein
MQRALLRRNLRWVDPVQLRLTNIISNAAKAMAEVSSDTTVELELRLGALCVDRRGHQRIAFPAASPTVMRENRTLGFFVAVNSFDTVAEIEGRLTSLVRHRPTESLQMLIHTECEKRFIFEVLEEDSRRLVVKPMHVMCKRRIEHSDIYLPMSSSDIRIALSTETKLPHMSDCNRKKLRPLLGRLRSRKSYTVDALLRIDISHVDLAQGVSLEREWKRDLTKKCELFLPRRGSEINFEIELHPDALRRVRRQEMHPGECASHVLGVVKFLAGS